MARRVAGFGPLAVIVLVAVVARVAYLGEAQLTRDEAASWYLSSQPLGSMLRLSTHETFPPLYLLLLKAWMAVFGDTEEGLRSLSVVVGILTVLVCWRWARDAVGELGAVVAGTMVALSPALVLASRNTRMYSLETFFTVGGWWILWLLVAKGSDWTRWRRWMAGVTVVLLVAGEVWSMSLGIPTAALQLAFCLIAVLWIRSRATSLATGCVLLGAISLAPWLPNLLSVATNGSSFWTAAPDAGSIVDTAGGWLIGDAGGTSGYGAILVLVAALACGLALFGLAALWLGHLHRPATGGPDPGAAAASLRGDRLLALAVVLGVGLVPAVWMYSQMRSIYDSRYLDSAFPLFSIAVAVTAIARGLDRRLTRVGSVTRRIPALLAIVAIVCAMAVGAIGAVDRSRSQTDADPAREMALELSTLVQPGDVVVTLNAQSYFPMQYYFVRNGEASRLGVRLFDWHRPSAAFFTGWQDIDDAAILDASKIANHGWQGAAGLAPGRSLWLVTLVDPGYEFPLFAPLQSGAVREIRRMNVLLGASTAQVREAVPVYP